jgi:hypothetical protein
MKAMWQKMATKTKDRTKDRDTLRGDEYRETEDDKQQEKRREHYGGSTGGE